MSDYGSLGAYSSLGSYANYSLGTNVNIQGGLVNDDLMQLQSLTFLNPEYELETFLNDYMDLRMFTGHVTIYSDSRDEALKFAYSLNQTESLGICVFNKQGILLPSTST